MSCQIYVPCCRGCCLAPRVRSSLFSRHWSAHSGQIRLPRPRHGYQVAKLPIRTIFITSTDTGTLASRTIVGTGIDTGTVVSRTVVGIDTGLLASRNIVGIDTGLLARRNIFSIDTGLLASRNVVNIDTGFSNMVYYAQSSKDFLHHCPDPAAHILFPYCVYLIKHKKGLACRKRYLMCRLRFAKLLRNLLTVDQLGRI